MNVRDYFDPKTWESPNLVFVVLDDGGPPIVKPGPTWLYEPSAVSCPRVIFMEVDDELWAIFKESP